MLHLEITVDDPIALTEDLVPVLAHPRRSTVEAATVVDLSTGEVAGTVKLDPPSAGGGTAGWVATFLVALHGAGAPVVSFFETA